MLKERDGREKLNVTFSVRAAERWSDGGMRGDLEGWRDERRVRGMEGTAGVFGRGVGCQSRVIKVSTEPELPSGSAAADSHTHSHTLTETHTHS